MDWLDRVMRDFNATLGGFRVAMRSFEERVTRLEGSAVAKQRRLDAMSHSLEARTRCEMEMSKRIDTLETIMTATQAQFDVMSNHGVEMLKRFDALEHVVENIGASLAGRAVGETKLSKRIDALVDGFAEINRRQALIDQYWQGRDMSERDKAEDFYRNGAVTGRFSHSRPFTEKTMPSGSTSYAFGKPFEECTLSELCEAYKNMQARKHILDELIEECNQYISGTKKRRFDK